ncbi:formylglycine-generating enzyme family protein [Myxococcota bacterium]|nr:formylglycine-generating enzyme family protein [Myxococcota bacterium]MBU1496673.1 formylglycine-generating enzyme family protein [Myxococcota bacterium]
MKKILIMFSVAAFGLMGCDDDSTSNNNNPAQGTLGGECYPNGTCNEGLECDGNNVCVEEIIEQGKEGGPCYEDDTCDDPLVCFNDICRTAGGENGPCFEDNTCTGELECIVDTCTLTGETDTPCRLDGSCGAQLVCEEGTCRTDLDEDGYSEANDCDDYNYRIFPGTISQCTSDCAWGTQVCQNDGTFTTCSASTDCACTTPGELEEAECRFCGWGYQRCGEDYQWEMPLECYDSGSCLEGTIETESCGFCGTRTRMCGPDCEWLAWSECTGQGECQAGLQEYTTDDCTPLGYVRERECDSQCNWVDLGDCTGDCLIAPRTGGTWTDGTPDFKDEVCVPAGPFYYGDDYDNTYTNDPMQIVYLSQFIIDIYEVSNDRYRECVDAGMCVAPSDLEQTTYFDLEKGNHPIAGITRQEGIAFCNWDGGKTLPTEAQWEKAARGPYPRNNIRPWGDEIPTCEIMNSYDCTVPDMYTTPVDSYPNGISYYGLYNTLGNVAEMILDTMGDDNLNYSNIDLINPFYNVAGTNTFARKDKGFLFALIEARLTMRNQTSYLSKSGVYGLRCGRYAF